LRRILLESGKSGRPRVEELRALLDWVNGKPIEGGAMPTRLEQLDQLLGGWRSLSFSARLLVRIVGGLALLWAFGGQVWVRVAEWIAGQ
jgi:hypothetical protein